MTDRHPPRRAELDEGHEPATVPMRPFLFSGLLLGGGIVAAMVLSALVLAVLAHYQHAQPVYPVLRDANRQPPEPRLQRDPALDLEELRRREDAALGSYGWADQKGAIAHVPIGLAMKLVAAGLRPAAAPGAQPAETPGGTPPPGAPAGPGPAPGGGAGIGLPGGGPSTPQSTTPGQPGPTAPPELGPNEMPPPENPYR